MTLKFRTAKFSDAQKLSRLVNSAYRGESSKEGWTTEADLLDGLRINTSIIKKMINDHRIEIILDDQNEITGCVYLEEQSDTFYLGMLTVKPKIQTQGLGKALLSHAETLAKTKNIKRIKMTVIEGREELIAFYERRGFKFTGKFEPFPTDPVFGITKKGPIRFKEFEKIL